MTIADNRMWGRDPPQGYGWTSIALHWASAVAITVLLFGGVSIGGESAARAIQLHTSVAVTLYFVLWGRIAWRIVCGHPTAAHPTHRVVHGIGVVVHFAILSCLAVMLVTGPFMAAAGRIPVSVFGLFEVPPVIAPNPLAFRLLRQIHAVTAALISGLVTVHVLGVVKHMVFDRDGVFDRIMIAAGRP